MRRLWPAALLALATPAAAAQPGELVPDVALRLLDGSEVRASALRGRIVILNHWATWCVPCRAELALLAALRRRTAERALAIFAISADRALERRQVAARARDLGVPVAMAVDQPPGWPGPIGAAVPTTYVLDRAGRIVFARAGALKPGEIEAVVAPLLESR